MAEVNWCMKRLYGLDSDGLPDWDYQQAYALHTNPGTAAADAVEAAKEY